MLFDWDANDQAYKFWCKKTRERIKDPKKRDILAPEKAPHAWGTKRPSLEQDYYEVLDDPKNEVVDIKSNPIIEVRENGILTEDGEFRKFDVIALATGFDSVTGGMKNMGLKDVNGIDLSEKWAQGTYSYLGMTCNDYPNMFFLYGAQGPTAFSNGPSCVECQGDWIVDAIAKLRQENITYLNATREGEDEWRKKVTELSEKTLFPSTNSWYMGKSPSFATSCPLCTVTGPHDVDIRSGANIPGKPREQLNYAGGIPLYEKECREALNNGFKGFTTQPPAVQA